MSQGRYNDCQRNCNNQGEHSEGQDFIVVEELPSWAVPMDCSEGGDHQIYHQEEGYVPKHKADKSKCTTMNVILSPVVDLSPVTTDTRSMVELRMSRKNKIVSIQWEPFMGAVSINGVAFLSVHQTIPCLPPHPVSIPVVLEYKGVSKMGYVKIDPTTKHQMMFYLDITGNGSCVCSSDHFMFHGGCISWITCN